MIRFLIVALTCLFSLPASSSVDVQRSPSLKGFSCQILGNVAKYYYGSVGNPEFIQVYRFEHQEGSIPLVTSKKLVYSSNKSYDNIWSVSQIDNTKTVMSKILRGDITRIDLDETSMDYNYDPTNKINKTSLTNQGVMTLVVYPINYQDLYLSGFILLGYKVEPRFYSEWYRRAGVLADSVAPLITDCRL